MAWVQQAAPLQVEAGRQSPAPTLYLLPLDRAENKNQLSLVLVLRDKEAVRGLLSIQETVAK